MHKHYYGAYDMNKSPKQFLTSFLTDSGLYSNMPVYGRMSFIQWPAKKYASLSSAQQTHADEEEDMGYESSWSEIFRSTRGWSKKSESLLTEMSHWKHLGFRVRANTKCLNAWSAECGEQAPDAEGKPKAFARAKGKSEPRPTLSPRCFFSSLITKRVIVMPYFVDTIL